MNNFDIIIKKLDEIISRLDKLEEAVYNEPHEYGESESSPDIEYPSIDPNKYIQPYDPNYPGLGKTKWNVCSKCGLDISNMSHYYCGSINCPMFLKATF